MAAMPTQEAMGPSTSSNDIHHVTQKFPEHHSGLSHKMDSLPTEICNCILEFTVLDSLKALRLTCKTWAVLGQKYLISHDLLCRIYRDDFTRLLSIANHPEFSPLVKTIKFEQGELHDYHARHNIYFVQYMKDPEERDRDFRETWEHYLALKAARDEFYTNNCSLEILTQAFQALPNLAHISVSLNQCPFDNPLLNRIWRISSSRLLPRVITTERFVNVLLAAATAGTSLLSLTHDRLPFEFWGLSSRILEQLLPAFSQLTDLRLCSDYNTFPNAFRYNDSFTGLATCLARAAGLRTLQLGFQASQKPCMDFEKYLGAMTWEHLHTLSLSGMRISAEEVGDLIFRHKASLRYLELGGREISVEHRLDFRLGTLKELLTRLRDNKEVQLEKLNLTGMVLETSGGTVTSPTWLFGLGVYDENWEEDLIDGTESARRMEAFMLGKAEWPSAEDGLGPVEWSSLGDAMPGDLIEI